MEKENLLVDVPKEQRAEMLANMAKKVSTEKVKRFYSDDEKTQMKDFVADESIEVMGQEEEFAKIAKTFRDGIKQHKEGVKDALVNLKKGYSENEENVYQIDNQEKGEMDVYDKEGVYLYSRRLMPDEKQTTILQMQNTGTHG